MSNFTLYTVTCTCRVPATFSTKERAADYAFECSWDNPKIEERSFEYHSEYLAARYNYGLNEKQHGQIYALAYERGHYAGDKEIERYYEELAHFAREILVAENAADSP